MQVINNKNIILQESEVTVYLTESKPNGVTNLAFPKEIISENGTIYTNKIDEEKSNIT